MESSVIRGYLLNLKISVNVPDIANSITNYEKKFWDFLRGKMRDSPKTKSYRRILKARGCVIEKHDPEEHDPLLLVSFDTQQVSCLHL